MEVRYADPNSNSSSRLEVSVDGLTLSPDPEDDQEQCQSPVPDQSSELQNPSKEQNGDDGDTAKRMELRWGFSLEELYGLALKFFKDKDGKAFHPTYQEKLRLVALHKQVLLGPYNPDVCPEVGFFDVLGSDRRKEWAGLGNMSKEDAMVDFVKMLNNCCNLFAPYVSSHKIEKEEQERKRREEEQRRKLEEEERQRRLREEEQRRREEEERRRREEEERRQAALQKQQEAAIVSSTIEVGLNSTPSANSECPTLNGQASPSTENLDREPPLELAEELTENGLRATDYTSPPVAPVITAPSMWTRPQIKDFKEKIRQDPDSVITVGRGEVVTVRVPTHEEGSYLFWEFATDHYDIGFGVFFEWTNSPNTVVSVHVSESSDEDEDGEGETQAMEEKAAKKTANRPQIDEIVPVYRRDCHEEVYAGSHQYPGQGIYLLKFDNSYSLWRSKSVYYRVYYTR
ncbi:hypothetical protein JZ751_002654 [Albula glossodonta]|uniref:Golgi resident protein GCP60 n=1 Tax=Albula glossodonta TaxID=121402 RepID=A0A8T2NIR2_9TELE|nr:hypothetical protein JZ751_002654 [Albula glossodonta]